MPGDEVGDRVHNFFAQDNSSWGQHQSRVLEGNWPVLNSSWLNGQRQIDVLNSSSKHYTSQNSDIDRGRTSYPVHVTNGLDFSQSDLRPDFCRSQSLNAQPNSNGFIRRNQIYQTRQNEANFLAVNTDSDQHHLIASRGLSVSEQQQGHGLEQQPKASDRPETSLPSVSFDLFGGHQQMNHQQASMMQALQRQQSGLNDVQQLQQQLVIRKMQDLQRQQQLGQLDLGPQDLINQDSSFTKHVSGHQSTQFTGTSNSGASQYPRTFEPGTNWLSHSSPAMQGSPGGLVFPPNIGQSQNLTDLVPQQVDQSLFGVPVSSSRGLAVNQYSQMEAGGSSVRQMPTSSNSLNGNQHNIMPDQIGIQEGTCISSQKFQTESMFGYPSGQFLNTGMTDMVGLQQLNSIQRNAPQMGSRGRRELDAQLETSHEIPSRQVSSSQSEVALDPTEAKILYGSDDNIWAAFGKSSNSSGEAGNLLDNVGLSNGLPSIQSGSWSALMQSAVAENSGSDIVPQEEWSGVNFYNNTGFSSNQAPLMHNDNVKLASSSDYNLQIPSAFNSGSNPSTDDISTHAMEFDQLGHKLQSEPVPRVLTDASHRSGQSLEEARKWSNHNLPQKSVAEGTERLGNAPQHSLDEDRKAKTISAVGAPGLSGSREQPNGWNSLAAVPPGGDRVLSIHENEMSQNFQGNLFSRAVQGEVIHGSSSWKSNSILSSNEFGHVKSTARNHQANKGSLSLNDAMSSAENSFNVGVGHETSQFARNNYFLNRWKNAHPSAKFQEVEPLGRMMDQVNKHNRGLDSLNSCDKDGVTKHDMENHSKENSNDNHHSNLSQHISGGFRECTLSDASDSRSLATEKQKSVNLFSNKASVSRKFQYHPLGNLDEDVVPSHGLKQPTQFELRKDNKGPDVEPSRGNFPGFAPSMPAPFSRPFDSYPSSNVSSPSQNMLELLHKVDQSRDHGVTVHLSSERNSSSQLPVTDKFDGAAGCLQNTQSSVSQGFGLKLGPPSQRLLTSDLTSSCVNPQGMIDLRNTGHSGAEMGGKGLPGVQLSSVQSLHFPIVESQIEVKNDRYAGPGHHGSDNSLYKMHGNYYPTFSSDASFARNQLQNNPKSRESEIMALNRHLDSSFTGNTLQVVQRGSSERVIPEASRPCQKGSLASSGSIDDVQDRGPAAVSSGSWHLGMPGTSQPGASNQVLHDMLAKVHSPQRTLAAQYPKAMSHSPELPQPNIVESSSQGALDIGKGGSLSSKLSEIHEKSLPVNDEEHKLKESSGQTSSYVKIDSDPKVEKSLGKLSSGKNHLDDSLVHFTSTQKDIEAFGRSLKPDAFSNSRHTLPNQMRVLKDMELDPSSRVSKRIKGPDNELDGQVYLMAGQQNENIVGNSLGSNPGVPSEDSRTPSFLTPSGILLRNTSPLGTVASQDIVPLGLDTSQSHPTSSCTTTVGVEHHDVGPQMAPLWFNQYQTFKNGQMLPMYNACNAHQVASLRPVESPFTLGKSSSVLNAPSSQEKSATAPAPVDECQVGGILLNSAPMSVANEHLSSSQPLQQNVSVQHHVILRSKKRKTATPQLYPWHKEISDDSQNLPTLSVAEADWSRAANHLAEKIEDDAELIEDVHPVFRSKRRLVLTTQLTQQLFYPPPATILSVDASSEYEALTYSVSRLALGDACSSVSFSRDLGLPPDGVDLHSAKGKINGDLHFAKVVEEFLGKARKLENDFLRLDKRPSILDLRVECQDLEKFSVINRFAKFHGRGQTDNAETASTDVTASTQKPCAQRYVTALPMPRCLPDGVQCLSL